MKKITALSVCLVMAASFVSCGDKDSRKKSEDKKGADKAASDYMDACYSKKGGEEVLSLMYPDEYIKNLKDDGDWKDVIDDINDRNEDILEEYKIDIQQITKGEKLKSDALEGAKKRFEHTYGLDSADVDEGYEYSAKIQITDRDNGEKEMNTDTICVVKLNGEWKVIPHGAYILGLNMDNIEVV